MRLIPSDTKLGVGTGAIGGDVLLGEPVQERLVSAAVRSWRAKSMERTFAKVVAACALNKS